MTTKRTNPAYWVPVFKEICLVLEAHNVRMPLGEAIFAYGLGYARGLQQKPIMDNAAVENIHRGWAHGASIETTDFIKTEEGSKT